MLARPWISDAAFRAWSRLVGDFRSGVHPQVRNPEFGSYQGAFEFRLKMRGEIVAEQEVEKDQTVQLEPGCLVQLLSRRARAERSERVLWMILAESGFQTRVQIRSMLGKRLRLAEKGNVVLSEFEPTISRQREYVSK